MSQAGVDVATSTPEELARLMQSELDRWGKVVRETGARLLAGEKERRAVDRSFNWFFGLIFELEIAEFFDLRR